MEPILYLKVQMINGQHCHTIIPWLIEGCVVGDNARTNWVPAPRLAVPISSQYIIHMGHIIISDVLICIFLFLNMSNWPHLSQDYSKIILEYKFLAIIHTDC